MDLRPSKLVRPVRIGLLTPYFSFFDNRFPKSFRTSQEDYAHELAAALTGPDSTVAPSGLVDSPEAASRAEAIFRQDQIDVVVAAPLMAAPPGFVAPMLASLQLPVVLWLDDRVATVDDSIGEVDATRYSSLLGSMMLSSTLRAAGVKYHVLGTAPRDGRQVVRAARGASVKTILADLRIGIVGEPIPGYADVLLDPRAAEAMGVSLARLGPEIFSPSYATNRSPDGSFWPGFAKGGVLKPDAEPALNSSIALTYDFERAVEQHDLDVLVINCHSKELRFHAERGIVGCLGASVLTTRGIPVSCTGDGATAVALAIGTWLAGDAQYAEGYVTGRGNGDLLISSCGLGNLHLREPSQPLEFHGNDLYPGACGEGCCLRMAFRAGPTTILALGAASPAVRPRFIWKTGTMSGRYYKEMNGPTGTFSFDPPGSRSTSVDWVDAGPAHHVAVIPGHLDVELGAAAAFVDAEFVMAGAGAQEAPS